MGKTPRQSINIPAAVHTRVSGFCAARGLCIGDWAGEVLTRALDADAPQSVEEAARRALLRADGDLPNHCPCCGDGDLRDPDAVWCAACVDCVPSCKLFGPNCPRPAAAPQQADAAVDVPRAPIGLEIVDGGGHRDAKPGNVVESVAAPQQAASIEVAKEETSVAAAAVDVAPPPPPLRRPPGSRAPTPTPYLVDRRSAPVERARAAAAAARPARSIDPAEVERREPPRPAPPPDDSRGRPGPSRVAIPTRPRGLQQPF